MLGRQVRRPNRTGPTGWFWRHSPASCQPRSVPTGSSRQARYWRGVAALIKRKRRYPSRPGPPRDQPGDPRPGATAGAWRTRPGDTAGLHGELTRLGYQISDATLAPPVLPISSSSRAMVSTCRCGCRIGPARLTRGRSTWPWPSGRPGHRMPWRSRRAAPEGRWRCRTSSRGTGTPGAKPSPHSRIWSGALQVLDVGLFSCWLATCHPVVAAIWPPSRCVPGSAVVYRDPGHRPDDGLPRPWCAKLTALRSQ